MRAQDPVQQQASQDVELRLSDLQTQIDRLNLVLREWQSNPDYAAPTEARVSELLERCTETLTRVTAIDERNTTAIAKLEARLRDWSFIEARLEQDSDQRIRQFEQIIEHEWEALRKLHEEPAKQLQEQAATLGETCIAAANLALRGFERAEARFAALEAALQGRMTELAGELQVVVAALRSGHADRAASLPGDVSPFPLDSVMRIHDELRRSGKEVPGDSGTPRPGLHLAEAPAGPANRPDSGEDASTDHREDAEDGPRETAGIRRAWRIGIIVAVLGVVGASLLALWAQRRVEARLDEAAVRVTAAERQAATATELASRRIAETEEEAERKLAEARETARRAEIVSSVLAAPDLVRINLAGGASAPRTFAQVLWSRSRGLVFSASRVPLPKQGATYQLWLLTSAGPVSAGLFAPDSAGRATLATDDPPNIPRPVVNAAVTLEPAGGRPEPTGEMVLTRAQ